MSLTEAVIYLPAAAEPAYRARRAGAALARVLLRRFAPEAHGPILRQLGLAPLAGEGEAGAAEGEEEEEGTQGGAAGPGLGPGPGQVVVVPAVGLAETAVLMYAEVLQVRVRVRV